MADGPASDSPSRLDALEARVRRETSLAPVLGLVLGSGLGGLADEIDRPGRDSRSPRCPGGPRRRLPVTAAG